MSWRCLSGCAVSSGPRWFELLYRWLAHTDGADDLARPEIADPSLLGATRVINAVLPVA
jgi:hypothetical protein